MKRPFFFIGIGLCSVVFAGCAVLPFGRGTDRDKEEEADAGQAESAEVENDDENEEEIASETPRTVWRIEAGTVAPDGQLETDTVIESDPPAAETEAVAVAPAPPEPAPPPPRKRPLWKRILFFWRKDPAPRAPRATAVGSVYLINNAGGFVVIESPAAQLLAASNELAVIVDGRITATLRLARERRPPFVVADILSGEPKPGDRVYPVP